MPVKRDTMSHLQANDVTLNGEIISAEHPRIPI